MTLLTVWVVNRFSSVFWSRKGNSVEKQVWSGLGQPWLGRHQGLHTPLQPSAGGLTGSLCPLHPCFSLLTSLDFFFYLICMVENAVVNNFWTHLFFKRAMKWKCLNPIPNFSHASAKHGGVRSGRWAIRMNHISFRSRWWSLSLLKYWK